MMDSSSKVVDKVYRSFTTISFVLSAIIGRSIGRTTRSISVLWPPVGATLSVEHVKVSLERAMMEAEIKLAEAKLREHIARAENPDSATTRKHFRRREWLSRVFIQEKLHVNSNIITI